MKRQAPLLSIGLLAISLTACLNGQRNLAPPQTPHQTETHSQPRSTPPTNQPATESPTALPSLPIGPERTEATLLAVGDIMVHMPQLPAYYDRKSDRYDFTPWFKQVKSILKQGDWVIGNLETPIAGKELKYTGYPRFNAPYEIAEAVAGAGIQLVSTANNHAMDRGYPGIIRTLANLKQAGLIPIGTSSSAEEQQRMIIEERNGIRMGFLAYSYGTNGIPLPSGNAYAVNLIDPATIKKDIARLRQAEADIVTVSLHYGIEYQRMPNEDQTKLARDLVEAGADIILGSHSHVVQPYNLIYVSSSESDDGKPRQGVVIYSLGNFISNQTGNWKDVGLIFGVRVVKIRQADGSYITHCDAITTEPTWVHIDWKNHIRHYTVIPMKTALNNKKIPDLTAKDYGKMRTLLKGIDQHLLSLEAS